MNEVLKAQDHKWSTFSETSQLTEGVWLLSNFRVLTDWSSKKQVSAFSSVAIALVEQDGHTDTGIWIYSILLLSSKQHQPISQSLIETGRKAVLFFERCRISLAMRLQKA